VVRAFKILKLFQEDGSLLALALDVVSVPFRCCKVRGGRVAVNVPFAGNVKGSVPAFADS